LAKTLAPCDFHEREECLMKFNWLRSALAVICCSLATTTYAAVIVNDTWRDGTDTDPAQPTYSENGVDTDGDGDIESVWYRSGAGTLDPVGPGGPLRADFGATTTSSASWTTYFTPEASPVTLANAGDAIRLTWNFRTGDVNASNTSQSFRFALLDSETRLTADGTPSGNATGYAIFGNMGETLAHNSPFNLKNRTGNSNILSAGADWNANLANDGSNGNPGYTDNTDYSLVWTVTRNANGNHDIVVSMTGGNLNGTGSLIASASDVAPNGGSQAFDTFAIRPSQAVQSATLFDTSLFKVEFISGAVVPEPASVALFGLSALIAVMRRQR
jgi:hypothetical protein